MLADYKNKNSYVIIDMLLTLSVKIELMTDDDYNDLYDFIGYDLNDDEQTRSLFCEIVRKLRNLNS